MRFVFSISSSSYECCRYILFTWVAQRVFENISFSSHFLFIASWTKYSFFEFLSFSPPWRSQHRGENKSHKVAFPAYFPPLRRMINGKYLCKLQLMNSMELNWVEQPSLSAGLLGWMGIFSSFCLFLILYSEMLNFIQFYVSADDEDFNDDNFSEYFSPEFIYIFNININRCEVWGAFSAPCLDLYETKITTKTIHYKPLGLPSRFTANL